MGVVEGITEWLPISSTGHMILVEQIIQFNASEEFLSMFRVVIQLGAILAVVVLFWHKLWPFGLQHGRVVSKPQVWQLWFKVVAATLPVLVISPLDDWMEARFYNYITVAAMLILYGVLFILVENRRTTPHVTRLEQITYREAFLVGVWQMLAIIPGTSRSGATIVGGLLLGLSRACVAEFTFFLAIPVMAGASLLKVVKFVLSGVAMTGTEVAVLVVGCVVAFVVSLAAIRFLMDYVKRHNFKFFGLYRIVLGAIVLAVAWPTASRLRQSARARRSVADVTSSGVPTLSSATIWRTTRTSTRRSNARSSATGSIRRSPRRATPTPTSFTSARCSTSMRCWPT